MHKALEDSEKRFSSLNMKRLGVTVLIVGEPRESRRTSVPGRIWNWFVPTLKAQAVYEPGGEVYISGWDDGDHSTWEGNVYAIDYETQGHYATDTQIYVADPGSAPILWDYGWISSPPVDDDIPLGRRHARATASRAAGRDEQQRVVQLRGLVRVGPLRAQRVDPGQLAVLRRRRRLVPRHAELLSLCRAASATSTSLAGIFRTSATRSATATACGELIGATRRLG